MEEREKVCHWGNIVWCPHRVYHLKGVNGHWLLMTMTVSGTSSSHCRCSNYPSYVSVFSHHGKLSSSKYQAVPVLKASSSWSCFPALCSLLSGNSCFTEHRERFEPHSWFKRPRACYTWNKHLKEELGKNKVFTVSVWSLCSDLRCSSECLPALSNVLSRSCLKLVLSQEYLSADLVALPVFKLSLCLAICERECY